MFWFFCPKAIDFLIDRKVETHQYNISIDPYNIPNTTSVSVLAVSDKNASCLKVKKAHHLF